MPRRTSIMLEVSDEVYDTLVEPLKKSKQFSKLLIRYVCARWISTP